jgi:hypothetical protein
MNRMDLAELVGLEWMRDAGLNGEGFWTVKGGRIAIGVVLLGTADDRIVVVRKKGVGGYEFSEMLALPGGITRGEGKTSFEGCVEQSIFSRAGDEAGLRAENIVDIRLLAPDFVPVTRYTAKGAERFTAVLTVQASLKKAVRLAPSRKSISEAFYAALPLDWKSFAPANRLILARALAGRIGPEERAANDSVIDDALAFCNDAARVVGLPQLPHPWRP